MLEKLSALNETDLADVSGGAYQGACFVYVVRSGDCLSVIAQKYNTTVALLQEINNIEDANSIQAGKKILIPYRK